MPVAVEGRLNVGGFTAVVAGGFTRPADTTQYTANDVVSNSTSATNLIEFKDCVRTLGGTGLLYSALMFVSTDAATNPHFNLVLFDTQNLTVAADNSASTITDAQARDIVAVITFDGTVSSNVATVGANLIVGSTSIGQGFKCAQNSRDLYGLVIDRGGYTPASAEQFFFKLAILQD